MWRDGVMEAWEDQGLWGHGRARAVEMANEDWELGEGSGDGGELEVDRTRERNEMARGGMERSMAEERNLGEGWRRLEGKDKWWI
ncbi:unnamed protein product [Calypogeia fissa]